jgi:hypothetical protein
VTPDTTPRTFGLVLRDLLIEKGFTSKMGNADFAGFSRKLKTTHYEVLRKAVSGARQPSPSVMEDCAETLGVSPIMFVEYRLWQARREFDATEVGLPAAMEALQAWRDGSGSTVEKAG